MNLKPLQIISILLLQSCFAQDYASPTYNPDNTNPTYDYNTNDQYDPNRRFSNRNPYDLNKNENRNQDQRYNRYDNQNDPQFNQNSYSSDNTQGPSWDSGRTYTSYKSNELEHDSVIINEA